MSQIQTTNLKDSPLTVPMSPMDLILKKGSAEFLNGLRIKSSGSDIPEGKVGDWILNKTVLGDKIKAFIGPWRYAARRWKNRNSLDLYSFNIGPGVKYDSDKNDWILDPSNPFTKDFLEILEEKIPSKFPAIQNTVGFDVLLYLPEIKEWCFYFIGGSAKNETSVFQNCREGINRVAILGTQHGLGKNNYYTPNLRFVDEKPLWPENVLDKFNDFVNPEVEVEEDTNARPR